MKKNGVRWEVDGSASGTDTQISAALLSSFFFCVREKETEERAKWRIQQTPARQAVRDSKKVQTRPTNWVRFALALIPLF